MLASLSGSLQEATDYFQQQNLQQQELAAVKDNGQTLFLPDNAKFEVTINGMKVPYTFSKAGKGPLKISSKGLLSWCAGRIDEDTFSYDEGDTPNTDNPYNVKYPNFRLLCLPVNAEIKVATDGLKCKYVSTSAGWEYVSGSTKKKKKGWYKSLKSWFKSPIRPISTKTTKTRKDRQCLIPWLKGPIRPNTFPNYNWGLYIAKSIQDAE